MFNKMITIYTVLYGLSQPLLQDFSTEHTDLPNNKKSPAPMRRIKPRVKRTRPLLDTWSTNRQRLYVPSNKSNARSRSRKILRRQHLLLENVPTPIPFTYLPVGPVRPLAFCGLHIAIHVHTSNRPCSFRFGAGVKNATRRRSISRRLLPIPRSVVSFWCCLNPYGLETSNSRFVFPIKK